ncbi:MAG: M23 family metallopeptidase [Candidatus Cloacimonetes bacterium]|nr:M23 family metallopeptidase [Candidatus Cloacimonadota bacterium]
MFKTVLIILVILLLILSVYLLVVNNKQSIKITQQESDIEALNVYVQSLNDKLKNYEQDSEIGVAIPKTQQIRDLLDNYLRDRNKRDSGIDISISTEELREDLEEFQLRQRFIPNQIPIKKDFVVSQSFSENHKGIDYAAQLGAEVVAAASGVIKSNYEDKYFGNVIIIDHLNHYITFYAHLARTFHQEGFFVEKGQVIGLVGSTGFSKYPHLHYEVIYRGENFNPEDLIE